MYWYVINISLSWEKCIEGYVCLGYQQNRESSKEEKVKELKTNICFVYQFPSGNITCMYSNIQREMGKFVLCERKKKLYLTIQRYMHTMHY